MDAVDGSRGHHGDELSCRANVACWHEGEVASGVIYFYFQLESRLSHRFIAPSASPGEAHRRASADVQCLPSAV